MKIMSNAKEIKNIILEISKIKFRYNNDSKTYECNNKSPREIPKNHFTELHKNFKHLFLIQLKENCNKELILKYIDIAKTEISNVNKDSLYQAVTYNDRKEKGLNTDENIIDFKDINTIISTQQAVLLKIKSKLEEELEFVDFRTSVDYQQQIETNDFDSSNIPFSDSGRATFKMSKKESLMLLYILEQCELMIFESDDQRRMFIENSFNFTEVRKNKNEGKALPLIGTSSEISDFKSRIKVDVDSNNRTLEKLLKKLTETIHLFEFKK